MNTIVELCAEATRLAEPLSEPGPRPVDDVPFPCTEIEGWERQYNIAVLTLACFADWDRRALRRAQRFARKVDARGHHLLWSAGALSEWPPAFRVALMQRT